MAYDQALSDRIADFFTARRITFEIKTMMGGPCFMVDNKMCVGVLDQRLMVRFDPALDAGVMQRPGCKPMDFTGRVMKGFAFIDPIGTESDASLRRWLELALDFNPRAKSSRKKTPRKR